MYMVQFVLHRRDLLLPFFVSLAHQIVESILLVDGFSASSNGSSSSSGSYLVTCTGLICQQQWRQQQQQRQLPSYLHWFDLWRIWNSLDHLASLWESFLAWGAS
eukprot:CAMPEP_0185598958 /NCGR_PEP_ID=MMETSP0434-20130131/82357_1 /TAXON_ID=626734 ORGANISM="Favella taraikaensis, Strain Fe Narragansett Bay" /NCGR_SAMPLE_ID=MMETSP0434 /ASSEMBLY_ACC=CAM_ASM_000379 /LENGTH=103 /DNA_ID=CAMNT_0028228141 /DNA_START=344 /DNA_END=655 /DNA_ORIENTATION=-